MVHLIGMGKGTKLVMNKCEVWDKLLVDVILFTGDIIHQFRPTLTLAHLFSGSELSITGL